MFQIAGGIILAVAFFALLRAVTEWIQDASYARRIRRSLREQDRRQARERAAEVAQKNAGLRIEVERQAELTRAAKRCNWARGRSLSQRM